MAHEQPLPFELLAISLCEVFTDSTIRSRAASARLLVHARTVRVRFVGSLVRRQLAQWGSWRGLPDRPAITSGHVFAADVFVRGPQPQPWRRTALRRREPRDQGQAPGLTRRTTT